MNLELFILGGYGQFIWPAFIFTFVSCIALYKKTKKELQKQETMYLCEYEELHTAKIKSTEEKKMTEEVLSGRSI